MEATPSIESIISTYEKLAWSVVHNHFRRTPSLGATHDKEDVVQLIFIRWIESLPKYDSTRAKLITYLTLVADSTCKSLKLQKLKYVLTEEEILVQFTKTEEKVCVNSVTGEDIRELLLKLSQEEIDLLIDIYWRDKTLDQIGIDNGLGGIKTAKNKRKVLDKLRTIIYEHI